MPRSEPLSVYFNDDQVLLSEWNQAKMRQKLAKRRYAFGRGVNLVAFSCREIGDDPNFDWEGTPLVYHVGSQVHDIGVCFHAFPQLGVVVGIVDSKTLNPILAKSTESKAKSGKGGKAAEAGGDAKPTPPPAPAYPEQVPGAHPMENAMRFTMKKRMEAEENESKEPHP